MFAKNSCDGCYSDFIDIRFTKACDNNCAFCIEKKGIPDQTQNIPALIESTIKSGKTGVLILGGEPLLNLSNTLQYIEGIRPHMQKIYLTTSLPHSVQKDLKTFNQIADLLDGLNVSLQHWESHQNNFILQASSNHNRIELLKTINKTHADKIRTSINLVKGAIDNKTDLNKCLDTLHNIGCKHVKINELQNADNLYVSYEKLMNIKLKSPYAHGCQTEHTAPNGMKITLKRSCFITSSHLQASFKDLIKSIFKKRNKQPCTVLYENGKLSKGWI